MPLSSEPKSNIEYTKTEIITSQKNKKLISIILPIYNEEKNIPLIYEKLAKIIEQIITYDFEIIIVNDGSKDKSWSHVKTLVFMDTRIKAIKFSRNFGHQVALAAGYDNAQGDAIITMDADLQHPPEIIPQMLEQWHHGIEVVYIKSQAPINGILKKITAKLYYLLLDKISSTKIPQHVQDFRLIDKKVLDAIKQSKEMFPFWRGLVAWTGFSSVILETSYNKRLVGKTSYSFVKMLKLAFDGITGFSLFPLKLAAFIGGFVIATGMFMFIYITFDALFLKIYYPLFKWLVTIIYIFMGVQFLLLWLIGEYIGRIFEQQKGRPLYIVEEALNFQKKAKEQK